MSTKFIISKCLLLAFVLLSPTIVVQCQDERLSKEEIERMNREADEAAKRDQNPELAKSFRARNELEKYAYSLLTLLDESADKLSDEDKQVVNDDATGTIKW